MINAHKEFVEALISLCLFKEQQRREGESGVSLSSAKEVESASDE